MVSLITEGSSTDDQGRPFRRRRAWPVIAVFAVLALIGSVLWVRILSAEAEVSDTVACNLPQPSSDPSAAAPLPLGTVVDRSKLLDVDPAPSPPPRFVCSTPTVNTVRRPRWQRN